MAKLSTKTALTATMAAAVFRLVLFTAIALFPGMPQAQAIFVTPLDKTVQEVRVCPKSSCPQMDEHPLPGRPEGGDI